MIQFRQITFLVIFFIFIPLSGFSQTRIPLWLGIGGGYGAAFHSTDGTLQCLNDPACPVYKSGTGGGVMFGASLDWRISSGIGLLLRSNFTPATAKLTASDSHAFTKNENGEVVPLVRSHSLNANLSALNTDLFLNFYSGNFHFFGGGTFGLLMSPEWSSSSEILSPSNVTFGNNRRDTLFFPEQAIANATSSQIGISAGIGYDIPLSKKTILVPELSGTLPLGSLISSSEWKQTIVALGVSVRFGMSVIKPEEFHKIQHFDTITVKNPAIVGNRFSLGISISKTDIQETEDLKITTEITSRTDTAIIGAEPPPKPKPPVAKLTMTGVYASGEKKPLETITVRGKFVTEGFPMLPFVFFEGNSAEIASRYHQVTSPEGFSFEKLTPSPLIQHKDILNIIGSRMAQYSGTKITLHGTADPSTENSDCALAESRANRIKQYLTTIWSIEEKRIKVIQSSRKCTPESPTTSQNDEGYEENRRVEIDSDDDELLAPMLRTRYIEIMEVTPPTIETDVTGSTKQHITSWKFTGEYNRKKFFGETGSGAAHNQSHNFTDEESRTMQNGEQSALEVNFSLTDSEGLSDEQTIDIPVIRDTIRQAVERLSLMHFEVLKDKLNRSAKSAIKKFVKDLDNEATISVVGYTDNLGEQDLNNRLATGRANAVAEYIKSIKPSATIIRNEGVGSTRFPPGISSHSLPESRFLSRTVQIEILRNWQDEH
ncbi:MAG: OmpA family protein [Ignavibacteriae bacterium]|nr:OmpA family protein [Ignavibacteriota bacterium]